MERERERWRWSGAGNVIHPCRFERAFPMSVFLVLGGSGDVVRTSHQT